MKKIRIVKTAFALAVLLTMTACGAVKDGDKTIIKEPGKIITIIEDEGKEPGKINVSVEKIDRYENLGITDWLDQDTVIISKENESLGKMSLAELADFYPRSLYLYDLNTKEYKLLKERKNMFLGGATLSPDKKHLLYYENSLGDPVYYVMNLETLEAFGIYGENIGGAYSGKWADNDTAIGGAYSGGAYLASTAGKITRLEGLEEALYIVGQIKDKVYYNTNDDATLRVMDLTTKEKTNLNIKNVSGVFPSPDGNQMLILQDNGSKRTMILCDADGGNSKTLAEGEVLDGVSWSPDQRMIAYHTTAVVNGATTSGIYIYDLLTGEATQIAVDIENATTCWSPSGKELVFTEWDGAKYISSIVHLKLSAQE